MRLPRLALVIGWSLFSLVLIAQSHPSAGKNADFAQWKTFSNRAGWTIKHPANWSVGSCRQCADPTDPKVFVTLYNSVTKELIMIEHLIDKPNDQTVDQWLNAVKFPFVEGEWISLDGNRALKVNVRNPDSTESESIYVVHGSQTFAIHGQSTAPYHPLYLRMLSTFRFTSH